MSNSVRYAVILNRTISKTPKGCIVSYVHNGRVMCHKGEQNLAAENMNLFMEFRLYSCWESPDTDEVVERTLPMTMTDSSSVVELDAKKFVSNLFGGADLDAKFKCNIPDDIAEELVDNRYGSLRVTFSGVTAPQADGFSNEEEEYSWVSFSLIDVEVEVFESRHDGRDKLDSQYLHECAVSAAAPSTRKGVGAAEMAAFSQTYNQRKKDRKRAESQARRAADTQVTDKGIDLGLFR